MMYLEIFTSNYINNTPISGIVTPNDINYLKRLYIFNRDSIKEYYQSRNFAVKNTHILSRILEHFPSYLNYDNYRYVDYSSDKLKYLAKHFKFTSDIEKGIIHPDYFFGNDGEEIIFASDSVFNADSLARNWKHTKAITVLKHCRNDTRLLLPLGSDDGNKSGISSIVINVPKLALQFREFNRQQMFNTDILLNKNHFVIKYVITNMIEDIIDHTLLNRIMDTYYGNDIVTPKFKHRFKIYEPETQLNRFAEQTLDVITSKHLDFINILHNIQLIFKVDASELLVLPDLAGTIQTKANLFISRIDYMKFLYDITPAKSMNNHYLNDWKRLSKRILRENLINGQFSYSREKEILEKIYEISNY